MRALVCLTVLLVACSTTGLHYDPSRAVEVHTPQSIGFVNCERGGPFVERDSRLDRELEVRCIDPRLPSP